MDRLSFEELELQMQQSGLSRRSYLQQVGVSYSTYHYWHKKCSAGKVGVQQQDLTPISIKSPSTRLPFEKFEPQRVTLLFTNGLRAYFNSGSENLLKELLTQSLQGVHV